MTNSVVYDHQLANNTLKIIEISLHLEKICFLFSTIFAKVEILPAHHFIMQYRGRINQFQACHSETEPGPGNLILLDPNEFELVGLFPNHESSYSRAIFKF